MTSQNPPANPAPPNVIWIFGDQHRGQATGFAGDPNLHTPNIDRMAAEGVSFNALSNCPLCCPARGSLLTSRYPHECVPGHEVQLSPEQPTIAHVLNENGYHTAYFGKWHLDGFHESTGRAAFHIVPPERRGGFDYWQGYENNNSPWDCWVHGDRAPEPELLPGYETEELTSRLIAHLRRHVERRDGTPFFSVLSVQPPHNPYVAPAHWMERHTSGQISLRQNVPPVERIVQQARRELAGYYAAVEALDHCLGQLRDALTDMEIDRNTLIIFFSDHGDMLGSHGQFRKTCPWEEAVRVPCIIGGGVPNHMGVPSNDAGSHSYDLPFSLVDLAPTTLGMCGIEPPAWMRGFDYSPLRTRRATPAGAPDSSFLQLVVPTRHGDSTDRPWRGLVSGDGWKYVVLEHQPWLLYNLNEDPYEFVNLAHNSRFGRKRKQMQDRLSQWIRETGDSFALPELDSW